MQHALHKELLSYDEQRLRKELSETPSMLETVDSEGQTLLHIACQVGTEEQVIYVCCFSILVPPLPLFSFLVLAPLGFSYEYGRYFSLFHTNEVPASPFSTSVLSSRLLSLLVLEAWSCLLHMILPPCS